MNHSPIETGSPSPHKRRTLLESLHAVNWWIVVPTSVLCVVGWLFFRQFADYQYLTDRHVADIMRAKLWSIAWLMISFGVVYWKRRSTIAPTLAVLAVSAYFVVLYGYLFRGTEFGMNGHWGDNGYRLATVCKMMAYGDFADAYARGLPSMYPPLWFWLSAWAAKITGLQAYHTVKLSYLVVFLFYPWALYFMWKPLISRTAAAAVAIATLFIGHNYLNYTYYEHMTAALFIPWWLYYFEDARDRANDLRQNLGFYLIGVTLGSVLFMTYYYWFFLSIIATPISMALRVNLDGSFRGIAVDLKRRLTLAIGVTLVTAVYWLPLAFAAVKYGVKSKQTLWFGMAHADLSGHWQNQAVGGALILLGVFFTAYLWSRWPRAKIGILYLSGLVLIAIDRAVNTSSFSIQTRKILEFTHVFLLAPAAIGTVEVWRSHLSQIPVRRGVVAVGLALALAYSNEHVESLMGVRYDRAINQRPLTYKLEVIDAAGSLGKVYLTNHYIEACYRPYFMFVTPSNVPAHQSSQYETRISFLHAAEQIQEPDLLAYSFIHNRFDRIDFVYLPLNTTDEVYFYALNYSGFNRKIVYDTLRYASSLLESNESFSKVHRAGLFEVSKMPRSAEVEARIKERYPEIANFMKDSEPRTGSK